MHWVPQDTQDQVSTDILLPQTFH